MWQLCMLAYNAMLRNKRKKQYEKIWLMYWRHSDEERYI